MRRRGERVERHHEEEPRRERKPGEPVGHRAGVMVMKIVIVIAVIAVVACLGRCLGHRGFFLDGREQVEPFGDDHG